MPHIRTEIRHALAGLITPDVGVVFNSVDADPAKPFGEKHTPRVEIRFAGEQRERSHGGYVKLTIQYTVDIIERGSPIQDRVDDLGLVFEKRLSANPTLDDAVMYCAVTSVVADTSSQGEVRTASLRYIVQAQVEVLESNPVTRA